MLVWLLIGIALALPGGLYLLQTNLASMSDRWEGRPGITVYLRVDADAQVGETLRDELADDPRGGACDVDFGGSRPRGVREVHRSQRCVGAPEKNPLPASLRIVVKDGTDRGRVRGDGDRAARAGRGRRRER